jgi:PPOX class probable F420-dependent enzyme
MKIAGATDAEVEFLLTARVGRLGTVDPEARPHVLPVCFALFAGCIYLPLDEKPKRVADGRLRRVQNIVANPAVCLTVDRYSEDWAELAWLQVRGTAKILQTDADQHVGALVALRGRYPQYQRMALEQRPMLEIWPERIVSWRVNR